MEERLRFINKDDIVRKDERVEQHADEAPHTVALSVERRQQFYRPNVSQSTLGLHFGEAPA